MTLSSSTGFVTPMEPTYTGFYRTIRINTASFAKFCYVSIFPFDQSAIFWYCILACRMCFSSKSVFIHRSIDIFTCLLQPILNCFNRPVDCVMYYWQQAQSFRVHPLSFSVSFSAFLWRLRRQTSLESPFNEIGFVQIREALVWSSSMVKSMQMD